MAAISSDSAPEDVLPALARNVVTNGYQASHSNEALEQTEYLKLVHRYLSQARELEKLAGERQDHQDRELRIAASRRTAPHPRLPHARRLRQRSGARNRQRRRAPSSPPIPASRCTTWSRPCAPTAPSPTISIPPACPCSSAPITGCRPKEKEAPNFIDAFLAEPVHLPPLSRLLQARPRDRRGDAQERSRSLACKAYAHVLDFFGGMFEIRGGKAVVPGGQRAAAAWTELAGVSPDQGAAFFDKLIARDDGWLASLLRCPRPHPRPRPDYLTDPARMKRFYTAVRGRITSPGSGAPRVPLQCRHDAAHHAPAHRRRRQAAHPGQPGRVAQPLHQPSARQIRRQTDPLATTWKEPDDVLEALFALSRKAVENEPLKIFMAMNDLDREPRRSRSRPTTVDRLAREYRQFGSQYAIFNDRGALTDKSILQFLDTADGDQQGPRSAAALRLRRAPCRRWSGCGRSSRARAAFRPTRRMPPSPASSRRSRQVKNRPRPVRCRPQRREAAAARATGSDRRPRRRRIGWSTCWPGCRQCLRRRFADAGGAAR